MQIRLASAVAFICLTYGSASAGSDKYNITPAEHQACDADAVNLCPDSEDEDAVIACMKTKRASLSAACLSTFTAGLRKRHMSL